MYVCIYLYICVHVFRYTHIYIYMYIAVYMFICLYLQMYLHIHMHTHTWISPCIPEAVVVVVGESFVRIAKGFDGIACSAMLVFGKMRATRS